MATMRVKKTAFVRCSGASCRQEGVPSALSAGDCAQILEACPSGIRQCRFACLGGGSCRSACKKDAISLDGGTAVIDTDQCVGCGLCAKACPMNLISLVPSFLTVQIQCANRDPGPQARKDCPASCIGCGVCEKVCPSDAIHVDGGVAVTDPDKCIACGMCAVHCPRGAIRDIWGIFTEKPGKGE